MTYLQLAEFALIDANNKAVDVPPRTVKLIAITILKQMSNECGKSWKTSNLFEGIIDCMENGEQSDYATADFTKDATIL